MSNVPSRFEHVDESVAEAGDVIVLVGALQGESDIEHAVDVRGVERSVRSSPAQSCYTFSIRPELKLAA